MILLVEDESRPATALIELSHVEKYPADHADSGKDGLYITLQEDCDVIILDVMLSKADRFAMVHTPRRIGKEAPVLMLAAWDEIRGKIGGPDRRASGYMTKPFIPEGLLARVRALSRRRDKALLNKFHFGDFYLSPVANELAANGKTMRLASKEIELLKLLITNKGATLGRGTILRKLWGDEGGTVRNNVEVYISFLRKKPAFLESPVRIQALRRRGYRPVEGDAQ